MIHTHAYRELSTGPLSQYKNHKSFNDNTVLYKARASYGFTRYMIPRNILRKKSAYYYLAISKIPSGMFEMYSALYAARNNTTDYMDPEAEYTQRPLSDNKRIFRGNQRTFRLSSYKWI